MASISSRKYLEESARLILWKDILEPEGFVSEKLEKLRGSDEHVINWTYDDGELTVCIQTFGEDEPAYVIDWNHAGSPQLTKLEAIKKFRGGDNWNYTKALISESINIGESAIDKVARKRWEDYQQSSLDMSPEVRYISDPLFQGIVDQELGAMIARDYAKLKFDEMKFALEGEPQKAISLSELMQREIPQNKWVVDGLLIKSGKAFLAAKAKAGKTTLCVSLLKSLADGQPFLGKFDVDTPEGRIGYMNLELTESQMQEWVVSQDIENHQNVHFWNLRGKPNPFRSTVSRAALIDEIQGLGIKTLIIDTFAKIFPGQANDNSEVNRFLVMLDDVLDKAGIEQLVMLVHAGNDAKKIRGATALTDHPDSIWFLISDEERNRYFSAIGRDTDIPEGLIVFDQVTKKLEFNGSGKKEAKESGSKARVLRFIEDNPGAKASEIDDSIEGTKTYKIKIRKQLQKEGLVLVKRGPGNSDLYFVA